MNGLFRLTSALYLVVALCTACASNEPLKAGGASVPALRPSPHFQVLDLRPAEELRDSSKETDGNTYEVLGEGRFSPTLRDRLVSQIDIFLGERGKGKTLEILSIKVHTMPDSRGVATRSGPSVQPDPANSLGRLLWRQIDRAVYGRTALVDISGRFDGIFFLGVAQSPYRTDPTTTAEQVSAKAIEAAVKHLGDKLSMRDVASQADAGWADDKSNHSIERTPSGAAHVER
jgi:hypothetical protein